jgi:hypothetical protein
VLIAVACCPQPPLLVPALSVASDPEIDQLRAACTAAVDALFASDAELLLIVGGSDVVAHGRADIAAELGAIERIADGVWQLPTGACGSFADFGVDLRVRLSDATEAAANGGETEQDYLPLSLLTAGWLLRDRPTRPPRHAYAVDVAADAASCRAAGRRLADAASRVGMLVMADGATHDGLGRAADQPHGLDHSTSDHDAVNRQRADDRQHAEEFDARVASALARADLATLATLDADEAGTLAASGRAAWQLLAAAAATPGASWHATSHYTGRPYEVGYTVASWVRESG